jgi:hypothetical protein
MSSRIVESGYFKERYNILIQRVSQRLIMIYSLMKDDIEKIVEISKEKNMDVARSEVIQKAL